MADFGDWEQDAPSMAELLLEVLNVDPSDAAAVRAIQRKVEEFFLKRGDEVKP